MVNFENYIFIKKQEVCTGSPFAPVLSEIVLNEMDVHVDSAVRTLPSGAVVVRRYVGILICAFDEGLVETVKKCLVCKCQDLTFMEKSTLQGNNLVLRPPVSRGKGPVLEVRQGIGKSFVGR